MYKVHKEGTLPTNGEVFVFGSNLAGRHGAGAAKIAIVRYGAIYGIGTGIQGQSYGLPTKDEEFNVRSLEEIQVSVEEFLQYASDTPGKVFFVSGIGCGYAGYCATQIAPFFKDAGENVSLPDIFHNVIQETNQRHSIVGSFQELKELIDNMEPE